MSINSISDMLHLRRGKMPEYQGGKEVLKRLAWLYRVPAVVFATLFLFAGVCFGSSHDVGVFLLSIPVMGVLLLTALVGSIWGSCIKVERGRVVVAVMLICMTPLAYLSSYGTTQWVRFLIWAPTHHRQLARAEEKDGIIVEWDGWGGIGAGETSSYLVVDTKDRLRSKVRADEWTKQIGQTCGMSAAQKMWPKFYVVTTYTDCPYDGVPPSG